MNGHEDIDLLDSNQTPEEDRKEVDLVQHIKMIKRRRILVFLTFLLILIIVGCSYFGLDQTRKRRYLSGYEVLLCQAPDKECYQHLCPEGMFWNIKTEACHVQYQSSCCQDQDRIIKCVSVHREEDGCSRVQIAGVSRHAYKLFCKRGFLWVPWRKRCFRSIQLSKNYEH